VRTSATRGKACHATELPTGAGGRGAVGPARASDASLDPHAEKIVGLAAQHRLPAVYGIRAYVDAGGLMSYSPGLVEQFRRAAILVVKIVKGARPADLPIEQPTAFDLVINREAARRIRLAIPPAMLARATELLG
jgi:putative ABC transport system substrate-binding protein